jgi:hypothetical protein
MINEEWKKAYKEGFADGYAAAKKEMNYQNFPPVYYGGSTPTGPIPRGSAVMGTPTGGLSYAINKPDPHHKMEEHFVTGMTVQDIGC